MAILNYILWNGSPEIFSVWNFSVRWYGLFFALGFLISQQILYYIYKKEGKPESDVDTLTIYMVVATIVGARLGHVIFYSPEMIWENPLDIFLPVKFNPLRFTGLQGLASHGGAIGILFAIWLYSRKKKPMQNYFQVLDRIVIVVALTGALIRLGNYFNSEIIGKPTDKPWGVVFTGPLTEELEKRSVDQAKIIETIGYVNIDTAKTQLSPTSKPIFIYLFFRKGVNTNQIEELMNDKVRPLLMSNFAEFFDEPTAHKLNFSIALQENGAYAARIRTHGVSRHPAQLYESLSCLILFILLFLIWNKYRENLPTGRLFGIFLIVCFGLRFVYEYLKEPQVGFEKTMVLNMGQLLSIPLVLAGFVVVYFSYRKPGTDKV